MSGPARSMPSLRLNRLHLPLASAVADIRTGPLAIRDAAHSTALATMSGSVASACRIQMQCWCSLRHPLHLALRAFGATAGENRRQASNRRRGHPDSRASRASPDCERYPEFQSRARCTCPEGQLPARLRDLSQIGARKPRRRLPHAVPPASRLPYGFAIAPLPCTDTADIRSSRPFSCTALARAEPGSSRSLESEGGTACLSLREGHRPRKGSRYILCVDSPETRDMRS